MADHPDFLRAVLAAPDDDLPRLAYADWLEETGVETNVARAEFVRLQCASEGMELNSPGWHDAELRIRELYSAHRDTWRQGIREPNPRPGQEWDGGLWDYLGPTRRHRLDFRRGFLYGVGGSPAQFAAAAGGLFQDAPVREVRFHSGPAGDGWRQCPEFARLESLSIGTDEGVPPAGDMLSAGVTRSLRSFCWCGEIFEEDGWNEDGVLAVARTRNLPHLRELSLGNSILSDDARALLFDAPAVQSLTSLELNVPLDDAGIAELVARPWAGGLTRLALGSGGLFGPPARVTDDSLRTLAALRPGRLQDLSLGSVWGDFRGSGLRALARSDALAGLRTLNLSSNRLGGRGARALGRSPVFASLRRLNISHTRLDAGSIRTIVSSRHLAGLRHLNLGSNDTDPKTLRALARSAMAGSLTALELATYRLDDDGLRELVSGPGFPELRRLNLSFNRNITDQGVRHVVESASFPNLRELIMTKTNIGDAGARVLLDSSRLNRMSILGIYDCGISDPMLAELRKRFGSPVRCGN